MTRHGCEIEPVELKLALSVKFYIYQPHPPTLPPGKVDMQLEIDHIVGSCRILCLVISGAGR